MLWRDQRQDHPPNRIFPSKLQISGRGSDPDSTVQEGNPEGIKACEEYEAIGSSPGFGAVRIVQVIVVDERSKASCLK
jgi:hypothetical protein